LACASAPSAESADDAGLSGTIAYPFVDETNPLGRNGPEEKFIIRSTVGDREYAIEIPGGARDYDVQVPLADLGDAVSEGAVPGKGPPKSLPSAVTTDAEMKSTLPSLDRAKATDVAMLDGAFGAAPAGGPGEAPSYTLGIARINAYFKQHDYEYCLIEINALLVFYPTSPKLLTMKGTVLVKMRNYALAERAWIKALELAPGDQGLRRALDRLQRRAGGSNAQASRSVPVPKPVLSAPQKAETLPAH
jgi:hypothetical protein